MLHSLFWSVKTRRVQPSVFAEAKVENLQLKTLTNQKDNQTSTQASGENESVNLLLIYLDCREQLFLKKFRLKSYKVSLE